MPFCKKWKNVKNERTWRWGQFSPLILICQNWLTLCSSLFMNVTLIRWIIIYMISKKYLREIWWILHNFEIHIWQLDVVWICQSVPFVINECQLKLDEYYTYMINKRFLQEIRLILLRFEIHINEYCSEKRCFFQSHLFPNSHLGYLRYRICTMHLLKSF